MTTYSEEAVKAILDTAKVQADMLKERIAELEEGSLQMIASGWELHTGEITESDIIIYDFNMMEGVVFKKLKESKSLKRG